MPNIFIKILLFLSSYFPLTIIFFILYFNTQLLIGIFILIFGLLGFFGLILYLKTAKKINPISFHIDSISKQDSEVMSYIVTYIIPFLSIPFAGWQQAITIFLFLFIIGVLYVNSNMIHINPILNLLGFHLYKITSGNNSYFMLSKHKIRQNQTIKAINISDDILLSNYNDK
jgi:hypothetical protein